ncbi:MAG: ABC transporter ATP-binding protein [Bacillota bacterium]
MHAQREPLWRLYGYLGRRWPSYALGALLQIVYDGATQLILAWMLAGLTNAAVHRQLPSLINVLGLSLLGIVVASATVPVAARWRGNVVEAAIAAMRQDLFDHIQELPISYFERVHSGDTVSRLTNDITAAKDAMGDALVQFLGAIVTGVLCAVAMWRISWKFTALALLLGALPLWYNRETAPGLQKVNSRFQESLADLNSRLKDLLACFCAIKAFNLQGRLVGSYDQVNRQARGNGLERVRRQSATVVANDLFGTVSFLSLLVLGSYLMVKGEVSPGPAVAAVQLLNGLTQPFSILGDLWVRLQTAKAAAVRVFAVLDLPGERWPRDRGEAGDSGAMIALRSVQFAFDNKPVFRDLSLTVPHGQMVALVGPSGGGKSTILKLLLGFHQVRGGSILIAGHSLTSYTVEELREKMAFVPQEAYLYTGTIYDNIACGKLGSSEDQIIAAARAANAHDFIMQLPDGYQTQVGERGAQLSGGQRQRIAIARAILKNSPILLLDEATSSLDSESERLVQEALERLMVGRTTLVIAHRLSTIRQADCIHVIVDGQIVESGNHEQLMQLGGAYRHLKEICVGTVA